MRIRSAVAAVATLALTTGAMSYAAADPGDPADPGGATATHDPDTQAETESETDADPEAQEVLAEETLADAELLFDDDPVSAPDDGRDATLVLRDLLLRRNKLDGAERASANRLLARPAAQQRRCAQHLCVHWSNRGAHRVNRTDRAPRNGTPDYVDKVLKNMEKVHRTYVRAGYRAPLRDRGQGGNRKRDIYLRNVGSQGIYGYCTSDRRGKRVAAYCVLDNNFSKREFPTNTPLENMRVTAAHEYFHAVQFAYDLGEDLWFMEATATWAEDELFDRVNDNRNYLPYGQIGEPGVPLDSSRGLNVYGNWVFFRYLTERMPASRAGMPVLVRDMWRGAGRNLDSLQAVQRRLADRGRSFTVTYAAFAAANRRARATYAEGQALRYPNSPLRARFTLSTSDTSEASTGRLDHLSSATVRFRRGPGIGAGARVNLAVDMAATARGSKLVVTVYRKNGSVSVNREALDPQGKTSFAAPFGARVRQVEVTLVNASSRLGGAWNDQQANVTGSVI
jgi:hypothetical protein